MIIENKNTIINDTLIYEKYIDDLYAYSLSLTSNKDDCLDAIHDVFVQLYIQKRKFNEEDNIKAYLFRSLRNRIIDISRHLQKEVDYFDLPVYDVKVEKTADSDLLEDEERNNLAERVRNLLSLLNPRQREIIYLRYMHEMDYSEISDIMGINADSVRKQVARAIKTMRENTNLKSSVIVELIIISHLYHLFVTNMPH